MASNYSQAALVAKGFVQIDLAPVDDIDIGYPKGFVWIATESGVQTFVSNGDGTWTS
jgi:hypothetical protein